MGLSDFKFKGSLINSTAIFLKEQYGEEYVQKSIGNYYNDNTINSDKWYPVFPVIQWLYDSSVKTNTSFRDLALKHSRFVMANHISDVSRFFMKLSGTKRILDAAPQICSSRFNWIEMKNLENKNGHYRDEVIIPNKFSEFYLISLEGALDVIMSVCGNKMNGINIETIQTFIKDDIEFSKINYSVSYN